MCQPFPAWERMCVGMASEVSVSPIICPMRGGERGSLVCPPPLGHSNPPLGRLSLAPRALIISLDSQIVLFQTLFLRDATDPSKSTVPGHFPSPHGVPDKPTPQHEAQCEQRCLK